jgi:hypothetical protein
VVAAVVEIVVAVSTLQDTDVLVDPLQELVHPQQALGAACLPAVHGFWLRKGRWREVGAGTGGAAGGDEELAVVRSHPALVVVVTTNRCRDGSLDPARVVAFVTVVTRTHPRSAPGQFVKGRLGEGR